MISSGIFIIMVGTMFFGNIMQTSAVATFDIRVEVTYISTTKDWDGPGANIELWNQVSCTNSDGDWDIGSSTGSYYVDPDDSPWDYNDDDLTGQRLVVDLDIKLNDCADSSSSNDLRVKIFEADSWPDDDDYVTTWHYADFNVEDTSADYFYISGSGSSPSASSYQYSVTWKVWWL